jgi:hypothetical protein
MKKESFARTKKLNKKNGGTITKSRKLIITKAILAKAIEEKEKSRMEALENPKFINQLYISNNEQYVGVIIEKSYRIQLNCQYKAFEPYISNKLLNEDVFIYIDRSLQRINIDNLKSSNSIQLQNPNSVKIKIDNNDILFNRLFSNETMNYTIANEIKRNGIRLLGGQTRAFVKRNEDSVVKSDSSFLEYYRGCICFMLNIPINPPMGLLLGDGYDSYCVEKYIAKNENSATFVKCLVDKDIRDNTSRKYSELLETLKRVNIGGDFKLDNILFNSDGSFILTDFATLPNNECKIFPIQYSQWKQVAIREEGSFEPFESFTKRLEFFVKTNGKWNEIQLL